MRSGLWLPLAVSILLAILADEGHAIGIKPPGLLSSCPPGSHTTYTYKRWCKCTPPKKEHYGSLVFVIDITGSMRAEIDAVKQNIRSIIEANKRFQDYVIALFGDPYVRQVRRSSDKRVMWEFLRPVQATEGGDCPEFAMSGLEDAINLAHGKSVLFLFTDASAKDRVQKEAKVISLIRQKRIEVIVIGTGDFCRGKYKNEYHHLVAASPGGRLIHMEKDEIADVMAYVLKGVKGELSFKSFPKDSEKLRASLEGKSDACGCRSIRERHCKPVPVAVPKKPSCPIGTQMKIREEKTCSCKPIRPDNYGSLVFVVDTTNSMQSEIDAIKENIQRIVEANKVFSNYVIAFFGDPYVRQVTKSDNKQVLFNTLENIRAGGGGDCPEYALSGVLDGAREAEPNSVLFLFTDASAKDYKQKIEPVKELLVSRRIQVITVVTGDLCRARNHPYHGEYEDLAKTTGGQVAHLSKGELSNVIEFVLRGVAGEMSFKAFPSSGRELSSALKGSCKCRIETISSCVPSAKKVIVCPKNYTKRGLCNDGKRVDTRYTHVLSHGICIQQARNEIRYKGCEHTKCKRPLYKWSDCSRGWKMRTQYTFTYNRGLRRCVARIFSAGRARCKMPCPFFESVLNKSHCSRFRGKFFRTVTYLTNERYNSYLCRRVTKKKRVECILSPCPKSEVLRGICRVNAARGKPHGKSHGRIRSHANAVYTHDKHVYYTRNAQGNCIRRQRVQRRLCSSKMCRCFAIGDPHYKTFDRLRINFYGGCKYVLAETVNQNSECSFRISGKNWYRGYKRPHGGVTWTKYIEITIGGHKYTLGQQRLLYVDGNPTLVPHRACSGHGYIFYSGRTIEFASEKCGINVYWDGKSAAGIQINRAKYGSRVRGLCGNCDGDASNDLTDAFGIVYKDRSFKNIQKFAMSYLVKDKSTSTDETEECNAVEGPPEISIEVEKKYSEKEWCGIISKTSGPFAKCLVSGKISYEFYFRSCVIDLSLLEERQTLLKDTFCEIIKAVNEDCAEVGFEGIDWRKHTDCTPKCPPNSRFTTKMNPCPATCESAIFKTKKQCFKLPHREGCECKNGYVLDGQRCVRMGSCSCLACNDAAPEGQCERWRKQGHCNNLFETSGMLMACRKSCGFCHEKPVCEDYIASCVCAKAKATGNCSKSFYRHFCGLTCNWRGCPCRKTKKTKGKCQPDGTRKVTVYRYRRSHQKECVLERVERRESCRACISSVVRKWGKCNFCTGKRSGQRIETYRSGIRCLKRTKSIRMSCGLCKFATGKSRHLVYTRCRGQNTVLEKFQVKKQTGCYECKTEDEFKSTVVPCRKRPRVSTTPLRSTKSEKLRICNYRLLNCRCEEACVTTNQPTECKPRNLIRKRCVIRHRVPVWKMHWQYERLVREKLKTRCERYKRNQYSHVVCPKRLKSITVRGKSCKLSERVSYYHVNAKCNCKKVVKYRSKGFFCCPKPRKIKGACNIIKGFNVMRTVRTVFYKLVKGMCIRQSSGVRHQVCMCRPIRFKRECQFGQLSQRHMECRLERALRGTYCRCTQDKIIIPVTCRTTSTRRLTGCTIKKGVNRYMKVRYFHYVKNRCKCVRKHKDRLVWCGCHNKAMYEVKPCPRKCKDPSRCSNRCVKQHIRYVGVMQIRNKRKVCVRKIVSLQEERCCCSPVVLDLKPRHKCMPGGLLFKYTYIKKMCRGKRSKLAQCCMTRTATTRRVPCKQGVLKTEASRCGSNGYFTLSKTIVQMEKCKCVKRTHRSLCRCKCPKQHKRVICDAGKRIWRVTITRHKIVNCECKKEIISREFPMDPCKQLSRTPSKESKCDKHGIKKQYFFYSVRHGCKCKKRTKIRPCHCRCSSRVSYTRWRCNSKSGVRQRTKRYMVKRGCHCVPKVKVEKKTTKCEHRRKVDKVCRHGVLTFFLRLYSRHGCRCRWKTTDAVRRRCDTPLPPKETVREICVKNTRVIIRTRVEWKKRSLRLFDQYYTYYEKIVTKDRRSRSVNCKKRHFSPEVRSCRNGKYLKVTRYQYVHRCKCKVGSTRQFKSCLCRKSLKRESTRCDSKSFAVVTMWKYRKWSSAQERCIWVTKNVKDPIHCSFMNRVIRGRCTNGKTYKITTVVQVPDRRSCKCLKLKESRTANCFCKPIVRRRACDKGRTCYGYTFITPMKWNYKLSRCVPFGKTLKKRRVCCCSKKVQRKLYCAPDGHRRITRTWQIFSSRPVPRCIKKKQTRKVTINCQAAKYQRRLLRHSSLRGPCGTDNYAVIKYYRLRLNTKSCMCETFVYKRKRCRCRCRQGEKFERSFCQKNDNQTVRVYSYMVLKNCGCVKKLTRRPSSVRCRQKPVSSTWSKCNKKTCKQYRIDQVEHLKKCKCHRFTRRRLNITRRCCCNKKPTSDSVCTKVGWKVTTVYYNFDRRTRRCAKKIRQNIVQDDDLINCKNNPRFTRIKAANCALILYENKYWIDYNKCTCQSESKPIKAGKWCCSKEPKVTKSCKNRTFVYVKTVQKLEGHKCVNKYSYRKRVVPCRRQRNILGECDPVTGWATDYISEARVMLNCTCKRIRVPKKRRCDCPKPTYITDCLTHAGIVRRIRIFHILTNGNCIRKRQMVSQTKVCSKKPVLHSSSKCKSNNYITDTYEAQKRVGCRCVTRYFTKQRLCRCDPLRSKKIVCKGRHRLIYHYMHYVDRASSTCSRKVILKQKRPIKCRNKTRKRKCEPSGTKGRMVQKIERVIRHIRKCQCVTKRVIESTRVCKCPDPFKKRGSCIKETERRRITHYTFTLNKKHTKCRRHQRITHEVCYCKKRAHKTTKCDSRSGNNLIISTWRQFDAVRKTCVRKRSTEIQEVYCEERTTRTKTDCTATGVRTDIIKKFYKDFNTCSCRESPRPVKILCACVPKCHKKVKQCIGGRFVTKQKCHRLKAVSPFVNQCVPYYLKRSKEVRCPKTEEHQKFAACNKSWKRFHKWVYKNIDCKCKKVKVFWKKVRCRCPKRHCRNTCEKKGTSKVRRCTWYKLINDDCVKHVIIKRTPVKCLKRQEFWTHCRKRRAGGRWYRCTVLKNVVRSAVRNCKCRQVSSKIYERFCCCGPRTITDRCNAKTGVITRTITKRILVGEGFCKPVPRVKVIPSPTCRGSYRGENVGRCDLKNNRQKFLLWTVYREGCACKKRKVVETSSCGCRRKKPLGPFWTKCVKGVRKVFFIYFVRVKISTWRYKCSKKKVSHSITDHCGICGKRARTNRVCKGDYWLRITRGWNKQTRTIEIPGRYYGSIKISYRVCVRIKKTKASKSVSCADPPQHKARCNNFRKRIYRFYYSIHKCACRLRRSLVTEKACGCHKKNYSKLRCHPRTNKLVTSSYIYVANGRVCTKKRHDIYRKIRCNVGRVVRDKVVVDCRNGRRTGLSKFKKVRYFLFYYSNCKCKKRFIFKWKLCGCAAKRKREVCRNGKWYSTLYSVTPRYDRNACQVTKRYVNRDVPCARNAHLKRLSHCNSSCIRKFAVYYRRLDRRTCTCRYAKPIILNQVCGCNKCPKVGYSKTTKKARCVASEGVKIFTIIKKVFVHNGNLFNRWGITLPKYKCSREVKRKKNRIVCSKGTRVTKEKCKGNVRKLVVKRQVRVGCRCRVKYSTVPGGRCQCKGKKPKPRKVWSQDDCSKAPFMRRVTVYRYKLDKSNARKWKCKLTSKTIKERCGCPRNVKHSAYCNGKGSIIQKKTWRQFLARLRSCVWKSVISRKAASCTRSQLSQNNQPPRRTACNTASGFLVTYVKRWYEVDPRDCKCKLKTKRWRCPCRCAHKNHIINKRCVSGHIIAYTAVNYVKKGCKCLKTTRGRKKYVTCRHRREDQPDRVVIGKCQRKGPSRNAGYVRVVYEKEYPRRCACKVSRRKRWEPCDCSLIPQYKSRTRLVCHKSGAFLNRITVYYVVQTSNAGAAFCERRRRVLIVRINKCFDRHNRPLKRTVSSGFETCSRKRTNCSYRLLVQHSHVKKCSCKWRTVEVRERKCCCNRPSSRHSCINNDTKVKTTTYYILDGAGHCIKRTKRKLFRLEKKKACKYVSGYLVRCGKGSKNALYRKYYPHRYHFSNCKCVPYYKDVRVPCQCKPKKVVRKLRCDHKTNRWVEETVVRSIRGKAEKKRCVAKSQFKFKKTCTRRTPRITLGRCTKSQVRLRTTHFEEKRNCLCVPRKLLETITCKCQGKTWWVRKDSLCRPQQNGFFYYPKYLMGYRFDEKSNRCVIAALRTVHVICSCPKPMRSKRCHQNEWIIKEVYYSISRSKNTCERVERESRSPMTGCSIEKVKEEDTSYVDMKTGYKTIIYSVVEAKGCKCVRHPEKVVIEWICEIIMKDKIHETQECMHGVIYQRRAGTPYFNALNVCTVDYSDIKIDVTSYCPRAGKVQRKVVGSCNSKTGRQKVEYSSWKPNLSKCLCEKTVKIEHEICDCEPIHNRYTKRGCRNNNIRFTDTYIWTLVNGACVRGRQRVEREVTCRVGRFTKESQCDPLTRRKDITIIDRKLRNCSCKTSVKSFKCMCKCKKDRMTRMCDPSTGYTIITKIRFDLKQCACKKRVNRISIKPPAPCGKKTTKKSQCRRSMSSGTTVAGYQKVTVCKAKRRGCRCRLVCRSRKQLCYCSPDVEAKRACIGHTKVRVTTFKYTANYHRNKCEWKLVTKVTVNKDCYAMVDIPQTKKCNKRTGVLIIKHWRFQPIHCKCKKRVYKITKGRCKCNSIWQKVSEGQCDTTDTCTKPVVYEREELHGIRCIKKKKTEYVTCSCECKLSSAPSRKCNRSSGTWITSEVTWKLRCSGTTGSCKCERSVSKKRQRPKCNGKQELPYCNKRSRRVVVRYREERLSRSKCSCYWTVVRTRRGFCHCREPEIRRTCEAHKHRIKVTTITEVLDDKHWKCVRSRTSTHEPVRPPCKPAKSVKFIACNALKDRQEWKVVTLRMLHPASCQCIRVVHRYPQVCICKELPERHRYFVKCEPKTGKIIRIYRNRVLQHAKNGKKACNIAIKTTILPVNCGDGSWHYVGSPLCRILAKNGCDSYRKYKRVVRDGCTCKTEFKHEPCKCCCPKAKNIRVCSVDGERYVFTKHSYEKRDCKCVQSTRRWSVPVECDQKITKQKKCLQNGREKIITTVSKPVNCSCKKFNRISWCRCRCPKPIREHRCDAEKRQKVTSFLRFTLKGCKCEFKQDIERKVVRCQNTELIKYKNIGRCNMLNLKQLKEYEIMTFDEVSCDCKKKKVRVYKPCECHRKKIQVTQPCNRACRKITSIISYKVVGARCVRRVDDVAQVCCCLGKRQKVRRCDVKNGVDIAVEEWEEMTLDDNNENQCDKKSKVRKIPVLGCDINKVTYKDSKCVGNRYTRSYYMKVIQEKKHKRGGICQCVKKMVRKEVRHCKCPRSFVGKTQCRDNNVLVSARTMYILEDGHCHKYTSRSEKLLRCAKSLKRSFKWSQCDRRTCKQKKYGTLCTYKNCKIDVRVDYRNPKVYDCCCPSSKVQINFLECQDKQQRRVFRKFWQVFYPKRMVCKTFSENVYKPVKCGGWKARKVFPGACKVKGADSHYYQKVRIRFDEYEEGCTCRQKTVIPLRLCKCRKDHTVKACGRDGVLHFRTMSYRLVVQKGKRSCKPFVAKHWVFKPPCLPAGQAKWNKRVSKCIDGIKVVTDYRRVRVGCTCKKEQRATTVICSCTKTVTQKKRCRRGRWEITKYGKRLSCRGERFCSCVPFMTTTHKLPNCPKGTLNKGPCVGGFRKVQARLYAIQNCQCTLKEFHRQRRCPVKCGDLISSRSCRSLMKEGLCEHPERGATVRQICARTCGRCFKCKSPNTVKYHMYLGFSLKSDSRYSKRFYIKTISRSKVTHCMLACKSDEGCNSFDYDSNSHTCVLNSVTKFTIKDRISTYKESDHKVDEGIVHFVKYCKHKCRCGAFSPMGKCVCEGDGILRRCYKEFTLREFFNTPDGKCAFKPKTERMKADCENPCVDQIETSACRLQKQAGRCLNDRETRILCNKTCSRCACNKQYTVKVPCQRIKGTKNFERKIMQVRYMRAKCGICTTAYSIKSEPCKPPACFEQTIKIIGDCIAGKRLIATYAIELTDSGQCNRRKISEVKYGCRGVCTTISKQVSKCRYHESAKKYYRNVMSSFWVSDGGKSKELAFTRKYLCDPSVCPKEITFEGPCLLGHRFRYRVYYVLDYRDRCKKFVDAHGETCTKKATKQCFNVMPGKKCVEVKKKGYCLRHNGPSRLCMKTCGLCKPHAVKKPKKPLAKKITLSKEKTKEAFDVIEKLTSQYGGEFLKKIAWATRALSKSEEGKEYIKKRFQLPPKKQPSCKPKKADGAKGGKTVQKNVVVSKTTTSTSGTKKIQKTKKKTGGSGRDSTTETVTTQTQTQIIDIPEVKTEVKTIVVPETKIVPSTEEQVTTTTSEDDGSGKVKITQDVTTIRDGKSAKSSSTRVVGQGSDIASSRNASGETSSSSEEVVTSEDDGSGKVKVSRQVTHSSGGKSHSSSATKSMKGGNGGTFVSEDKDALGISGFM